jgi:pimeloyl-ACP methyl ester carboxylesterase
VWVTPGPVGAGRPVTSSERFAGAIADRAHVVVHALDVWRLRADEPYDLRTEIAAVERTAATHRLGRYHVFGFSAGATVVLAAARELGAAVRTVTVFEPATIGDDGWSPVETRWRQELARIRALPAERRPDLFRRLMMGGDELPPSLPAAPPWSGRMDRLEDLLAAVGFVSADLGQLTVPVTVLTAGLGHVRFRRLADRLVEVVPHAETVDFPHCSHLAPPHRQDPGRLADVLARAWR